MLTKENMMQLGNDTLREYMRDISHIPLVNRDEERELAMGIQSGSTTAQAKLISANLRLVVKIAHDFKGMGLSLQDLVSEGNRRLSGPAVGRRS